MEELKKNDFLATLVKNPDLTIADLKANDITPSNTSLLSKEEYKNMPAVIDAFKDDEGKFDEKKFNTVYDNARIFYSNYANDELFENIMQNLSYGQDEWFAPQDANYRIDNPVIVLNKRPSNVTSGISYLTEIIQQDSNLSVREQAQNEKVVDFETGETLDYSPNDKAGLFKRFSLPSLVIAQWDEDGTHIEDGMEVSHKAGDLKLNENGRPYYETLGNREIYDKDLLRASDVLTVDGSKWNKLDFFDSDDTKKSAGKVLLNLVAKVAPMFIPWGVGEIYGYLGAADGLMRVMPVLGKTINGIITGDNTNDVGKFLSKWEANAARFDETASDRGRESAVTLEGLGNMISAVSGQLFQQRAISTLPVLVQKARGIKDVSNVANLSRNLSLAYMAATSAQQVYGDFKQAGASDRVAGLGMLGSTLALYKLMNIDYFRDNLFKDTFMDESEIRSVLKGASLQTKNDIMGAMAKGGTTIASEKEAASFVNKVANFYTNTLVKGIQQKGLPGLLARGLSEGTEEVMEEVTTDVIKGVTEGLNALGIPVTQDEKTLDFGWSVRDFATRYGTSFVGGFIGGMVFAGQNAYERWLGKKLQILPSIEQKDMEKLVYYIANGKRHEIDSYLDKWHEKGLLGSKDVSIDGEVMTTLDGMSDFIPSTKGISQNEAVYRTLKGALDTIEQEFNSEVDARLFTQDRFYSLLSKGYREEDIVKNPHLITAEALTALGDYSSFQNDLYETITKLIQTKIDLKNRIKELSTSTASTEDEKKTQADSIKEDQKVKELQERLKTLREEKDKFFAGEKNKYYSGQAYFAANEGLHKNFVDLSLEAYIELKYGRSLDSFSEEDLKKVKEEYKDYNNKDGRQNIYKAYDLYLDLSSTFAPIVQERADLLEKAFSESKKSPLILGITDYSLAPTKIAQLKAEKGKLDEIEESKLTEEQIKRKVDIDAEILKLQRQISVILANPQLATIAPGENSSVDILREQIDDNKKITIYDDTSARLKESFTSVSEVTLPAQEILSSLRSQYQSDASNDTFRFDDAELNAFFSGIAASYIKTGGAKTRLQNFFSDAMLRYADEVDGETGEQILSEEKAEKLGLVRELLQGELSPYWADVIRATNNLVNSLGIDNAAAWGYYNEAVGIIKENTHLGETENQDILNDVLAALIPTINGESLIDIAQEFDSYKENINYSAFIDIAEKIGTDVKTVSLFKLVQQELQNLSNAGRIDDYIIQNKAIRDSLSKERLDPIFNTIKALVRGAADGTNDIINNFSGSKEGDIPVLASISENVAKMIDQQANELYSRIAFLRALSDANNSRSLRIHKDTALKMRPKWVKGVIDLADSIKKEFDIDVVDIWNKTTNSASFNPTENDFSDWESKCIAFEQELYNEFSDRFNRRDKESVKELADKLINLVNAKTLYKEASTRISADEKETISGLDLVYYLATIISVPTAGFYSAYRKVIEDNNANSANKLAPVYGQEYAIKQIVAQGLNPALYNYILDGVKDNASIREDFDDAKLISYYDGKQPLHNLSVVLGSAGAGKTVGVIKNILDILIDSADSSDVIFLAKEIEQADKVRENAGFEKGAYTVDQYCKAVFGEEVSGYKYKTDGHWEAGSSVTNAHTLFDTSAKLKILVIDEVETLTEDELQRICFDAEQRNILVIGAGDLKQPGTDITGLDTKGDTVTHSSGIEDCYFIKTPTLTTSMRSQTIAKVENTKTLGNALDSVLNTVQQDPTKSLNERASLVKESLKADAKLYYYENPTSGELAGDMGVESQEDFDKRIQTLSSLNGTVAIITDRPGDYTKYAKDGKVYIVPYEKRAGGEYDYVLVDVDFAQHDSRNGEVNEYLLAQDFYTLTQRSRKGTVIKTSSATSMFKFVPDETKKQSIEINPEELRSFVEWRLKSLDNIQSDESSLKEAFNESPLVQGFEGVAPTVEYETEESTPEQQPLPEKEEEKVPEGTKPTEPQTPDKEEGTPAVEQEEEEPRTEQPISPEEKQTQEAKPSPKRYSEALNHFLNRNDDNPMESAMELIAAISQAFPRASEGIRTIARTNKDVLGSLEEFVATNNRVKNEIKSLIKAKYGDSGVDVLNLMLNNPYGFVASDSSFRDTLKNLQPKQASITDHGKKRKQMADDVLGDNSALFDLLSKDEFDSWCRETRTGLGAYRDIRTTDLDIDVNRIPEMIRLVGSEVRNGKFERSFLRQFAKNRMLQQKFEAYGKETQIWIVPYTGSTDGVSRGLVVSRHIKDSNNYFDIPLMIIDNPSIYGMYTGTIDMIQAFTLTKSVNGHITLNEFLAQHPEVTVSPKAGVIEVKSDKQLTDVDSETEAYLRRNNGKVFLASTDEAAIAGHSFRENSKGVFRTDKETGYSVQQYGYYDLMGIQSKVTFSELFKNIIKLANLDFREYTSGNSAVRDIWETCSFDDIKDQSVVDSKGNRRQLVSEDTCGMILSLACLYSNDAAHDVYKKLSKIDKGPKYKALYTLVLSDDNKSYTLALVDGYFRIGKFSYTTGEFDIDPNTDIKFRATDKFDAKLVFETLFGEGVLPRMRFTYNQLNVTNQRRFIRKDTVNNELASILKHMTTADVEKMDSILADNDFKYGIYLDDKAQKGSEGSDYYGILDPGTRDYYTDKTEVVSHTVWAVNINPNTVTPADIEIIPEVTLNDFLAQNHLGITANDINEANNKLEKKAVDWKYKYIVKTDSGYEVRTYGDENLGNWLRSKGIDVDIYDGMAQSLQSLSNGNWMLISYDYIVTKQNGNFMFKQFNMNYNYITEVLPSGTPNDYVINKFFGIPYNQDNMINWLNNNLELAEKIAIFEDQFEC